MKKLKMLICGCLLSLLVLPVCEAAKTYKTKTKDSEVKARDEVVITISEPIVKTNDISLGQFKTRLARERVLRDGYIVSVIGMAAELILLQAEADKIVLKIPDPA